MASLGEWQYALAWAACLPVVALMAAFLTPAAIGVLLAVYIGSVAHTAIRARRSGAPYRVLHWMPWACLVGSIATSLFLRTFVVEAFKSPSSSMYPTLHIGDHFFAEKLTKHWRSWQRGEVIVHNYPCDPERDYIKRIVGLPGDTVEVRCNVLYVNGKAVPSTLVPDKCSYQDYDESADRWYDVACSRYHESLDGHEWDVFHDEDRPEHDALWKSGKLAVGDRRDFPMRDHPFPPGCADARWDSGPSHAPEVPAGKLVETKPEAEATVCEQQLHYVVPDGEVFVLGDNRNNSNDSRVWGGVPISYIKGRVTGIWWSSHESGRIGAVH